MKLRVVGTVLAIAATVVTGCSSSAATTGSDGVPAFSHIVVAVIENHSYSEILQSSDTPFLRSLAQSGAVLTSSRAVTHPSQPNYLAMFSGSTQGLTDDSCPHHFSGPNLAEALQSAKHTFTGYSEGLPAVGFTGCTHGAYARKHNPWVDFPALPASVNQPMTAFPTSAAGYAKLPNVSFVIPDLDHDMHDGTVRQGDQWLHDHLGGYATWAATHNSLLIITADEDDGDHDNRIATILSGADVRQGEVDTSITHYGLLRTLLDAFSVKPFGQATGATGITDAWQKPTP